MALATKCPHCNTIFRVAADQLKLRGGIVRCGSCHQVFDGNSALVEPAAKPTPVIPDVVAERAAPAHTTPTISDYVHGTPVDFELDFADEASHAAPAQDAAPPAPRHAQPPFAPKPPESASPRSASTELPTAKPADAVPARAAASTLPPAVKPAGSAPPQAEAPAPAVWRTAATQAPAAEPSPDDAARAAVARAFAAATTPSPAQQAAPQPAPPQAPLRPAEPPTPAPPAPHPLAALVSPDDAFSEAAGEPPVSGPWTPSAHPPATAAVPPAAAPSAAIDEKLLVWEDIPANASAASDAAAMAAVARAFNNAKSQPDEKKAPAEEITPLVEDFLFDTSGPAHAVNPPSPAGEAPSAADAQRSADAQPAADVAPAADELPAADEPVAVDEPAAADQPPATGSPSPADVAAPEPAVEALTDGAPAAGELPTENGLGAIDELPAGVQPLPADAPPPAAGEAPAADDLPSTDGPAIGELPAADEPGTADAPPPAADEAPPPPADEASATDEQPAADEQPATGASAEPDQAEPAPEVEAPAIVADAEPSAPAGAALIEAIDQWSADNAHPDGRIEPSFDIPQEHIVLAAIDDAHHFEDLPPADQPHEAPFAADANVSAEVKDTLDLDADAAQSSSEPSLAEEPWSAAAEIHGLSPTGEPWSLSEPEPERDATALHAVAAVNTDVPDDGESLPIDEEQAEAEAALAAARMRALAGVDEADDLDHSDLSFVKRVDRSQKYGKAASITMAIGIPVLLAGLALQAATTFRDTLAASYPQLKPTLAAMCQPLGCKIALPTQLDALSIEQGELATMAENTFSFSTVLRNQSKTAQAWPHIELTLNDNADKPVLRRVFAPREYLPSPADAERGFGPRSEQSIKLYFELKELKASGYHIAIFYP